MACACGSSGRKSFTQIAQNDGGSLPMLKYLHCKFQDQFEFQFSRIGINATEPNLKMLAYAFDTGNDKKGVIPGKDGKPIYFSVDEVIKKIDKSSPSNNFCSI